MRLLIRTGDREIGVEGDTIVEPTGTFDAVFDCPDAEVHPGLINAHDHLHRNHYGRLGAPPYSNAYAWARDIQERHRDRIATGRAMPRRDALLIGAWKNLFAGVTSVVHHDHWEEDFDIDFPIRVLRVENADSLGMTPDIPLPSPDRPFCLHVAEGTDRAASREVEALWRRGLLGPNLIAVHGVGMDEDAIDRFRGSGAALVWCPSSNLFLLRHTAPASLLHSGVVVLLGSDSLLTGDGDLLDELRLARSLGLLDDARLAAGVGETAARRLGIAPPSLDPGRRADLILLARPLLEASADDVLLVLQNGVPRVATPDLAKRLNHLAPKGALMTVGSTTRWVNGPVPNVDGGRRWG